MDHCTSCYAGTRLYTQLLNILLVLSLDKRWVPSFLFSLFFFVGVVVRHNFRSLLLNLFNKIKVIEFFKNDKYILVSCDLTYLFFRSARDIIGTELCNKCSVLPIRNLSFTVWEIRDCFFSLLWDHFGFTSEADFFNPSFFFFEKNGLKIILYHETNGDDKEILFLSVSRWC